MKHDNLKLHYNLQTFAEDITDVDKTKDTNNGNPQDVPTNVPQDNSQDVSKSETGKANDKTEVDVQALLTELAKTKRALDKASSEAASYKKQYKETLSEKEQYDMEAAEAKAKHDEEFEAMKEKLAITELREQFVSLGYSKEQAATAAKAQYDNDVDTLLKMQEQFTKDRIEAERQKIFADMPQPNLGVGGTKTYTKQEFDSMNMKQRTKLKQEDEAEYNRLLKL